jgi:hypothetical protein
MILACSLPHAFQQQQQQQQQLVSWVRAHYYGRTSAWLQYTIGVCEADILASS